MTVILEGATLLPGAPIVCKQCGSTLGVSNGTSLQIGAVLFMVVTLLTCAACKTVRRWQPATADLRPLRVSSILSPKENSQYGPQD